MKNSFLLSFLCLSLIFNSCSQKLETIKHTNSPIIIDGKQNDKAWQQTEWRQINHKWLGEDFSKSDFNGKYKLLWDKNYLFVLAEITDDKLIDIYPNGLEEYWNDDCLEVFVDENASGGNHQYNYNAFAYHIALDDKVVDLGADKKPHYFNHVNSKRITNGNKSIWELSIEIYDDSYELNRLNKKVELTADKNIGFAIAYCDNDASKERENFIGSMEIPGSDKNRAWIDANLFEKMVLVK